MPRSRGSSPPPAAGGSGDDRRRGHDMERLTFNVGSARGGPLVVAGRAGARQKAARTPAPAEAGSQRAAERETYDWDYLWMLAFTALLFFRPQDQIPVLGAFHLAELTAIGGLAAMVVRRLASGQ